MQQDFNVKVCIQRSKACADALVKLLFDRSVKDDIKVLTLRGGFIDEHSKLSLTSPNKVVNSELQARQNEIVTLTDAANDVEELALTMDDDEKVIG